ncbi:DoxX family protein [Actinomadura craniellae]|uniref:DoxX family protein n=1 Tax=Actinomadura craniellae TaxID=2231787 RepID=A0A365H345_9ACTN|nr:DoxX family protein [Actinomadura craniellae]RAY13412.1 DoxX family protein [Actinomadura craniellae]
MRPIRFLARPLVAAPFVVHGLEALRDPRVRAEKVGPTLKTAADRLDWLPAKDPETLVRLQGALGVGAGALLAIGRLPRLTSLLLAAQLVPTLLAENRYWSEDDPDRRPSERAHLLKNAGLFGALLLTATEPRRHPHAEALRRQMRETKLRTNAEAKHLKSELRHARREAALQSRGARSEIGRRAERTRRRVAH